MRKVVVCANFGGHDYPKDPILQGYNKDWRYVYFTDKPFASDVWQVKEIHPDDARLTARHIKQCTHRWVKYDVCLWIDASMSLKQDPDVILDAMGDADMMFKLHPSRNTTEQEIEACQQIGHISEQDANAIRVFLTLNEYTKKVQESTLIFETGLYVKRNTDKVNEFMEMWHNLTIEDIFGLRDQLTLPYLAWLLRPKMEVFTQGQFLGWTEYVKHSIKEKLPVVHYVSPYAVDYNLGASYNAAANGLKASDYIALMDNDACFLDVRFGRWIAETIKANPHYDIFVPRTNRLRDDMQRVNQMMNVADIKKHREVTETIWKKNSTNMIDAERPPAGLCMIMKVSTLRKLKFRNGLLVIDTDFMWRAKNAGYKIGIMQGIYLFHYYRLAEGADKTGHLRGINL